MMQFGPETKVLIVDDEPLVARIVASYLEKEGITVIGPATTVSQSLSLIDEHEVHFAFLDVNLYHERSDRIAEVLREKRVPFAFLTGYGVEELPEGFRNETLLNKPARGKILVETLAAALAA